MQTKHLINREFAEGTGEALRVTDPSTGNEMAMVNEASIEQVYAIAAFTPICPLVIAH